MFHSTLASSPGHKVIPSLKLTVRTCQKAIPKGNNRLPTIYFQVLLLMAEIWLTTWDVWNPINNGINYLLVSGRVVFSTYGLHSRSSWLEACWLELWTFARKAKCQWPHFHPGCRTCPHITGYYNHTCRYYIIMLLFNVVYGLVCCFWSVVLFGNMDCLIFGKTLPLLGMDWLVPLPSNSGNEGLGWDPLLKMFHNPGGDCYWEGGQPKLYVYIYTYQPGYNP